MRIKNEYKKNLFLQKVNKNVTTNKNRMIKLRNVTIKKFFASEIKKTNNYSLNANYL